MLAGIMAQREREGHAGPHPYGALDLDSEPDRRIVASTYSQMARPAVEAMSAPLADPASGRSGGRPRTYTA